MDVKLSNDYKKYIHLNNALEFENNGFFIKSNYAN